MVTVNPSSINDLVALKTAGAAVTLTSHPGNASLYKLSLWQCGIPEHFWDVTCCIADANNWPMFRLRDGQAELLISEELYHRISVETNPERRFVTAYQLTKDGERLGRAHVRVCQGLFPKVISSCSRLLLSEKKNIMEMFEYLAETRAETVFARFVTPEGILLPIKESGLKSQDLADSFIGFLEELDRLLFCDEPVVTHGGACYDGTMVSLATMLVDYWNTGRIDRYDISGPDMIHYASRREHQEAVSEMLRHLRRWSSRLIPETIVIRMFPGTVARVGYLPGHVSEDVMERKVHVLKNQSQFNREQKRRLWEIAKNDEHVWPTKIKPSEEPYFSQHDLLDHGSFLTVSDFWRDIPFEHIQDTFTRANALLRLKNG